MYLISGNDSVWEMLEIHNYHPKTPSVKQCPRTFADKDSILVLKCWQVEGLDQQGRVEILEGVLGKLWLIFMISGRELENQGKLQFPSLNCIVIQYSQFRSCTFIIPSD